MEKFKKQTSDFIKKMSYKLFAKKARQKELDLLFVKEKLMESLDFSVVVPESTPIQNTIVGNLANKIHDLRELIVQADSVHAVKQVMDERGPEIVSFLENPLLNLNPTFKHILTTFKMESGLSDVAGKIDNLLLNSQDIINGPFDKPWERPNETKEQQQERLRGICPIIQKNPNFQQIQEQVNQLNTDYKTNLFKFKGQIDNHSEYLTRFENDASNACERIGMTKECISLKGQLGFEFNEEFKRLRFGGVSHATGQLISLSTDYNESNEITASTLAHEWLHSLDAQIINDMKKDALNSGMTDVTKELQDVWHVSSSSIVRPLDGTNLNFRFNAMKRFTESAFSKDFEQSMEVRNSQIRELGKKFLAENIGAPFFSITERQKQAFESSDFTLLLRNKMAHPEVGTHSDMLLEFIMKNTEGVKFNHSKLKTAIFNNEAEIFALGRNKLQEIEDVRAENIDKASHFYTSGNQNNRNSNQNISANYFDSNVEMAARQFESQLFPSKAAYMNSCYEDGCEIYSRVKDLNFERLRRHLIISNFGKESLRESNVPEREWHMHAYYAEVKAIKEKNANVVQTNVVQEQTVETSTSTEVAKPVSKFNQFLNSLSETFSKKSNSDNNHIEINKEAIKAHKEATMNKEHSNQKGSSLKI